MNQSPPITGSNPQTELLRILDSINQIVKTIREANMVHDEKRGKISGSDFRQETTPPQKENAAVNLFGIAEVISVREAEIEAKIKELRHALPATYFRNHSRVKHALDIIRAYADENQNDVLTLLEKLRYEEMTSHQLEQAVALLERAHKYLSDALADVKHAEPRTI